MMINGLEMTKILQNMLSNISLKIHKMKVCVASVISFIENRRSWLLAPCLSLYGQTYVVHFTQLYITL